MAGFGDIWVFLAYFLSILSAIACLIYGAMNWNKGAEMTESEEASNWRKEEIEMEKSID